MTSEVNSGSAMPIPGDEHTFTILCLAGGGYTGLFSAYVLRELEQHLGHPIGQCFDLIAGTSIGGIIALAIALDVPVATIVKLFEDEGKAIFPPISAIGRFVRSVGLPHRPLYNQTALRSALDSLFGQRTLAEARRRVIVPAFNLTTGRPQLFKSAHCPQYHSDHRLNLSDIALATSAAPVYFPPAELDSGIYADGGLFANAPDQLALHEAQHYLSINLQTICLLSVSTPQANIGITHEWRSGRGLRFWMTDQLIIDAALSSQQQIVDAMSAHSLNERYLRIERIQSSRQHQRLHLSNASAAAQQTLRSLGVEAAKATLGNERFSMFSGHQAAEPLFYHIAA